MNKKQAVAYAQIALDYMKNNDKENIDIIHLGIEMRQAFKMYPRDVALIMATNMENVDKEFINKKNGEINEK